MHHDRVRSQSNRGFETRWLRNEAVKVRSVITHQLVRKWREEQCSCFSDFSCGFQYLRDSRRHKIQSSYKTWCSRGFFRIWFLFFCQQILHKSFLIRERSCSCSLYIPFLVLESCGHDTRCLATLSLWIKSLLGATLTEQWVFPHTPIKEVKWRGPLKSDF